jgi:hypothetical protein
VSNHFPIPSPPPELVQQWENRIFDEQENVDVLLIEAYKAGADQELEACCKWFSADVVSEVIDVVSELRAARRPEPPSMKEQALRELSNAYDSGKIDDTTYNTIRRALEGIDD